MPRTSVERREGIDDGFQLLALLFRQVGLKFQDAETGGEAYFEFFLFGAQCFLRQFEGDPGGLHAFLVGVDLPCGFPYLQHDGFLQVLDIHQQLGGGQFGGGEAALGGPVAQGIFEK